MCWNPSAVKSLLNLFGLQLLNWWKHLLTNQQLSSSNYPQAENHLESEEFYGGTNGAHKQLRFHPRANEISEKLRRNIGNQEPWVTTTRINFLEIIKRQRFSCSTVIGYHPIYRITTFSHLPFVLSWNASIYIYVLRYIQAIKWKGYFPGILATDIERLAINSERCQWVFIDVCRRFKLVSNILDSINWSGFEKSK